MHMFSAKHGLLGGYAFIGEGIPIGVGAAFQSAYRSVAVIAAPGGQSNMQLGWHQTSNCNAEAYHQQSSSMNRTLQPTSRLALCSTYQSMHGFHC